VVHNHDDLKMRTSFPSSKPTIRDIADKAGVSIATVSYVVNGNGSVSAEIRKKVKQIAEDLGYQQNRAARAMKLGRSEVLGLVIPNLENPFFASLSQAVLLAAESHHYQVFFVGTEGSHETQKTALHRLAQQGVDGVILFPVDESEAIGSYSLGIPLVVLDRELEALDLVQAEYYKGGRLIAEHLLQLGHVRFGLLEGPRNVSNSRDRSLGFVEAIQPHGQLVWRETHPYTLALTHTAKSLLVQVKQMGVTAIVCGNDLIAMGVMQYLQIEKIRVPDDVSVVGFDDISFAHMMTPSLTTIKMPVIGMATAAVDLLAHRINEGWQQLEHQRIILDVKLIVRNSSAPPISR